MASLSPTMKYQYPRDTQSYLRNYLFPNELHNHSYYGSDFENVKLQQSMLWIQLEDVPRAGSCVAVSAAMGSVETSFAHEMERKKEIIPLCEEICKVYGLDS